MIFLIGLGVGVVFGKNLDTDSNVEILILFLIGLCALIKLVLFITYRHQKNHLRESSLLRGELKKN